MFATAVKYSVIVLLVSGVLLFIGAYALGFTISINDANADGLIVVLLTVIGGVLLGVGNDRVRALHSPSVVPKISSEAQLSTSECW